MTCSTKNLDFANSKPTQSVFQSTQWMRFPCLTTLGSSGSPLEFRVDRTNSFIDISQMYLLTTVSVVLKDGKKLPAKELVSTANNFGYSMFNAVELYIQDQKITQDQGLYPWITYIKLLTSCSDKEIDYFLRQSLWYRDEAGMFDQVS